MDYNNALGCSSSCCGPIVCDWCGALYNQCPKSVQDCEHCHTEECIKYGVSVGNIDFGGKQICECCFEKLAKAIAGVLQDYLPEYRKALEASRKRIDDKIAQVDGVKS